MRVTDASGNAVAGAAVTFVVTSGGGTIGGSPATSGSDALVSVEWTLGMEATTQTVVATVGSASVTFTADPDPTATLLLLPSAGAGSVVRNVNAAGTVIVGHSDNGPGLQPREWLLQNDGSWALSGTLPFSGNASAVAVNDAGDVAGLQVANLGALFSVVLWPDGGGGPSTLGCDSGDQTGTQLWAMSARTQVVVGAGVREGDSGAPSAAVWEPGRCRELLPPLEAGDDEGYRYSYASAVNADGTIVGGVADGRPVRWRKVGGSWQIEVLDDRDGGVMGGNAAGDLVGFVDVPCTEAGACRLAMVWYAGGGSRQLDPLQDAQHVAASHMMATAINDAGEVAGQFTWNNDWEAPDGAFFWSEPMGVRRLPERSTGPGVRDEVALSGVRPDGTRIVVGNLWPVGAVWVIKSP